MSSFNPESALQHFPCTFNLANGEQVTSQRLRHVRNNVENDPEILVNSSPEEKIRNNNLLTWAYFGLDKKKRAKELNEIVLELTQRRNLTALGNCIFLNCRTGNLIGAKKIYTNELLVLSHQNDFNKLRIEALAEQSYCYSRLGGRENYEECIKLFETCIKEYNTNYLWKFGLGLVYRRFSNYPCSGEEHSEKRAACLKLLQDVGENGDDKLKGLAYAQLTVDYCNKPCEDFDDLHFQGVSGKALQYGAKNPTVLTHVGRCMIDKDIDKAIEILEQSVELRPNSIAYHHLGECYMRKYRNNVCHKGNQLIRTMDNRSPYTDTETLASSGISQLNTENGSTHLKILDNSSNINEPFSLQVNLKEDCHSVQTCSSQNLPSSQHDLLQKNKLDLEKELLDKAEICYVKAIEVSHEENLPARLALGNFYFEIGNMESALAEFNQIIALQRASHLTISIQAYEMAGKCCQRISENFLDSEYVSDSKRNFTKAISLAADLVSMNEYYINSTVNVWATFKEMWNEVENMPPSSRKNKDKIKLLELVKQYGDVVSVVKEVFQEDPKMNDLDILRSGLVSSLQCGQYEDAFLLLLMAKTNSSISNTQAWSELLELRLQASMSIAYSRLLKMSTDSKRAFQHMFELHYGHCLGMADESREYKTELKGDILIVNDDSADTEDGPDFTTIIAGGLSNICENLYGLKTSRNLLSNDDEYRDVKSEIQLQEMKLYSLVVLILGENDDEETEFILKVVHQIKDVKAIVINCRKETNNISLSLKAYKTFHVLDRPLSDMKLPVKDDVLSMENIIEKMFSRDKEAVIWLFSLLVDEDFDQRREMFRNVESKVKMEIKS